jgi:hypothetical protein
MRERNENRVVDTVLAILIVIFFTLFVGYSVLKSAGDYFTSRVEIDQ